VEAWVGPETYRDCLWSTKYRGRERLKEETEELGRQKPDHQILAEEDSVKKVRQTQGGNGRRRRKG